MGLRLQCHINEELPKLAWLASVDRNGVAVEVTHGPAVESNNEDWLVEGVWDGVFEAGEFHRSEYFFGSGMRIEDDAVFFVPSSAAIDRLCYCDDNGRLLVSNSLLVLLAATGAELDPNHNYRRECLSILERGVEDYEKEFAVVHPRIKCLYQQFYHNMVLSSGQIRFEQKPRGNHKIDSYDKYYRVLTGILQQIRANYESSARKTAFSAVTTLSTGYDSTAVSCLAKGLGVRTCFTGNGLKVPVLDLCAKDNGTAIAERLGLDPKSLDKKRSEVSENELYFLATSQPKFATLPWFELSLDAMCQYIENNCSVAVVFTGHHGDIIWGTDTKEKELDDRLIRGASALSGMSLREIRLKSGFINLAVPFILARNIREIHHLSFSEEMAPWRLNNEYDRPIPRRILEDAGVDRQLFGMRKRYIANTSAWPLNPVLKKQFFQFMKKEHHIGRLFIYAYYYMVRFTYTVQRTLRRKGIIHKTRNIASRFNLDISFLMWQWATASLASRISTSLHKQ